RDAERRTRLQQLRLPDQLVEFARAHPDGERSLLRGHPRMARLLAGLEELVAHSVTARRLSSLWTGSALLLDMLPQYEPRHRSHPGDREGVAADRADGLRRSPGAHLPPARSGRPAGGVDGLTRLRGRERRLLPPAGSLLDPARDLLRIQGRRTARRGGRRP